tara:strand:+ start:464 stop:655 length:192 start_codon:yes stop_codon:yes gene_type:complete
MREGLKTMDIQLTEDQIVDILDCIENRIDDLNTCAMYGDGTEIGGELKRLEDLSEVMSNSLER